MNPEEIEKIVQAYELSDNQVKEKLIHHQWLTPELIQDVHDNEKQPEREDGLGPFKNPDLRDFPDFTYHEEVFPDIAIGFSHFLQQECSTNQGFFIKLNQINDIWDEELNKTAENLGFNLTDKYALEIDRTYLYELPNFIRILCAPERLRRQLISLSFNWGEYKGRLGRREDLFLLTKFVGKALDVYLQKQNIK